MDCHEKNFEAWFADILKGLYCKDNAGFIILMATFPLLERYLREKGGIHEKPLNDRFYEELVAVFPELTSPEKARDFWQVYRNGLLHQVAFSQKNTKGIKLPNGWVKNDAAAAVSIHNDDFWVHPSKFAERVIDTIQKDFRTFEGRHSTGHPLPVARQYPYLGTSAPNQMTGG